MNTLLRYVPLAQLVEHWTFNPVVGSSSLLWHTMSVAKKVDALEKTDTYDGKYRGVLRVTKQSCKVTEIQILTTHIKKLKNLFTIDNNFDKIFMFLENKILLIQ